MSLGYAASQGYTGSPSNPTAPKTNWYGPVSKGLNLASGIFDTLNLFDKAKQFGSSARDFKRKAAQALEEGFLGGIDIAEYGKDILGEQTAAFGKSGSALEGSPLAVLADTANKIDENVERAITQGRIKYAAFRKMARDAERQKKSHNLAGIGTAFGAVGTLVGGPFALIGAGVGLAASVKK